MIQAIPFGAGGALKAVTASEESMALDAKSEV